MILIVLSYIINISNSYQTAISTSATTDCIQQTINEYQTLDIVYQYVLDMSIGVFDNDMLPSCGFRRLLLRPAQPFF